MGIYEPFGGLIVFFFGHFKQLAPVQDVPLYKIPKDSLEGAVLQDGTINSLWNTFKVCELTKIMRQEDEGVDRFRNQTNVER